MKKKISEFHLLHKKYKSINLIKKWKWSVNNDRLVFL